MQQAGSDDLRIVWRASAACRVHTRHRSDRRGLVGRIPWKWV